MVFTIFRIAFIIIYSGQLNGDYSDVPTALFLGLRLSLKTAGIVALLGFVAATLPKTFIAGWCADKIRFICHSLALVFFAICFMARIPYYKIFNAAFNMMLVNGAKDDVTAIIVTAVKEYQLLWRLPLALLIAAALAVGLRWWLRHFRGWSFADFKHPKLVAAATLVFIPVLWVFVRYGGAFSYASSINWESAARLNSNLLNEAVLDDGQALYRVSMIKKKIAKITNIKITAAQLRERIAAGGGDPNAADIEAAFLHTVRQPLLAKQPANIVLIVGESFGEWPFLPKFRELGLVDNMLALANSPQAAHINTMLAHGMGTISAVNGLLTGLPDSGLYENYEGGSFKSQYATGIGYIMRQLGYKTVFWYGGFSGWQNIKAFVNAQSFDEFNCAEEFKYAGGNAWGCPDAMLFEKVAEYIAQEPQNSKTFHVVLTTSNHPPYTLDVDALGYPRDQVKQRMPADIEHNDTQLTEMGHIWYADKTMGDFVRQTEALRPDTLFVITGDHSERFSFAREQDLRTMSAIPCIFYGQGVQPSWFRKNSVGCHMQLAGTLAELVAPAGFTYSAMLPSMVSDNNFVFNHRLYASNAQMADLYKSGAAEQKQYANSLRNVAAWRVLKGNKIE